MTPPSETGRRTPSSPGDPGWTWPLAVALLLVTPCVLFAIAHGYPLGRHEIWGVLIGWASLGAAAGALLAIAGNAVRVPVMALGLLLFLDFRTRWIDAWDLSLLAAGVGTLLVAALLRRHLARIVAVVCATLLASSLVLPSGAGSDRSTPAAPAAPPSGRALPLWLHILLDEQIGVEGIPRTFDPGGALAAKLQRTYTDTGFRLFGRAYSRYYDTHASIANLFNFTASASPTLHLGRPFQEGDPLRANRYFEELSRRGHRIHVVQTDYIDLCQTERPSAIASCTTYPAESVGVLADAPLGTQEKARAIQGVYLRTSFLLGELQRAWSALREDVPALAVLPAWKASPPRVSAVATMQVLDGMEEEIRRAGPGAAFFVHLLLPHYPYAYDRECGLRDDPAGWLAAGDPAALPRHNTVASRAERYPRYLEQVACTHARLQALLQRLDEAGVLRDATVIVQGDHGSRIDAWVPHAAHVPQLAPADFIDGFSTFFAVRRPNAAAGYDRRMLPIDALLGRVVLDGALPEGTEWAPEPRVMLASDRSWSARLAPFVPHVMPPFADGVPE